MPRQKGQRERNLQGTHRTFSTVVTEQDLHNNLSILKAAVELVSICPQPSGNSLIADQTAGVTREFLYEFARHTLALNSPPQ